MFECVNKPLFFSALVLSDEQLRDYMLAEIEARLHSNGNTLHNFSDMPLPDNLMVMEGKKHTDNGRAVF